MSNFARNLNRAFCALTGYRLRRGWYPETVDPISIDIYERVAPYTLTGVERVDALRRAIDHVATKKIPGAFVECGVWRGGSAMAAMLRLKQLNELRDVWLYDTFAGMPRPEQRDVYLSTRESGVDIYDKHTRKGRLWTAATLTEVQQNIAEIEYPDHLVRYVRGLVEATIPEQMPSSISVLRLDTDLYSSTWHELTHLVPLISPGGVLIIDDYGSWSGARDAVDDYFANRPVYLHQIDAVSCMTIIHSRPRD